MTTQPSDVRVFDTGATRSNDTSQLDYEGFLSPAVLTRFAEYMHKHRFQADGTLRDSDNWQKGIPLVAYMKSLLRHVIDLWRLHRGLPAREPVEDTCCAIMFNAMGYLHEHLKSPGSGASPENGPLPVPLPTNLP